jgi:hypothetical protein
LPDHQLLWVTYVPKINRTKFASNLNFFYNFIFYFYFLYIFVCNRKLCYTLPGLSWIEPIIQDTPITQPIFGELGRSQNIPETASACCGEGDIPVKMHILAHGECW